ncbi:MAG: RDD family protein [Candidatus Rokubacteria bacterium]|nr:RDD family protein [Candidatus Rokubacteria bacterium]
MAETCPKCGYSPVEADECPRCRVAVSRYRAYLDTLGQKPAPPAPPPSPGVVAPPPPVAGGIWPEGSPAGFWVRGAALVVDSLVLQAVFLPFQLLIYYPTLLAGGIGRQPDPARLFAVNAGYFLVAFVVSAGYIVWMHGTYGQTLGKVATGVKVVKVDGEPIGYGRAGGRWLGLFLSTVTLGVGYLMAGLRSDKRALHDLVAGTRVMKVRRPWLEGKPAGFWMRFVALGIDGQALSLLLVPIGIISAIAIPLTMAAGNRVAAMAVVITLGLFLAAALVVYSVWMHGRWGQTLGKMALGMKVVRVDGSPLGYGGAFLRWFGSLLSGLILMIGYIMAGLRSDKRALHDLIAGSRVTYIR